MKLLLAFLFAETRATTPRLAIEVLTASRQFLKTSGEIELFLFNLNSFRRKKKQPSKKRDETYEVNSLISISPLSMLSRPSVGCSIWLRFVKQMFT